MKNNVETDFAVVYFDISKKRFLVVKAAKRGVGRGEIGDGTEIDEQDFDSRIADVLIQALDSFRSNVYTNENARGTTPESSRLFVRQNLSVHVERHPSGDIYVLPLHHGQRGYSGTRTEQLRVPKGDGTALKESLRQAFQKAT